MHMKLKIKYKIIPRDVGSGPHKKFIWKCQTFLRVTIPLATFGYFTHLSSMELKNTGNFHPLKAK